MDPPLLGGPPGGRRVAGVEGVAGGKLRGGGEASVDLGIPAMVVPSCV